MDDAASEKYRSHKPVVGSETAPPSSEATKATPTDIAWHEAPAATTALAAAEPPDGGGDSEKKAEGKEKKSLKERWRNLKEEDRRKKEDRITYVSGEEADRITGLERRRREEEEGGSGKKGRSGFMGLVALVSGGGS